MELALVLHVLHQVGPLAFIRGDDSYLFRIDPSLDEPVKVKIIKNQEAKTDTQNKYYIS